MKIIINQKDLKNVAAKAMLFVPTKSTLPQLENIRFSANGKLQLEATDLESFIRTSVPNKAREDGEAMIPLKVLKAIADRAAEGEVSLDVTGETGTARTANSNVRFSIDAEIEPLPILQEMPEDVKGFVIDAKLFAALVAKAAPFVSTDPIRVAMQSLFFKYAAGVGDAPDVLTIYATDGHRLIRQRMPFNGGPEDFELLVPATQLTKVAKVMTGTIGIAYNDEYIWFSDEQTVVQIRRMIEKFPNIEAVIPRDSDRHLTVARKDFLAAVDYMTVWANRNTTQLVFELSEQDGMTISAIDYDDFREAKQTVASMYNGEPIKIGFNGRLLRSVLNALEGNDAVADLSAPTRAVVFEEQAGSVEVLMLVMPVRLNDNGRDLDAERAKAKETQAALLAERQAALAAAEVEAAEANADEDSDAEENEHLAAMEEADEEEYDGEFDGEFDDDTDADNVVGA